VLTGLNVGYQLQGTYKPRDYCVQYRESDFSFASRLMEEEGIYYFFTHANGSHKMIVADTPPSHPDVPGDAKVLYEEMEGGTRPEDRVLTWAKSQEIRAGKVTLFDHCFELPGQNLEAVKSTLDSVQVGGQSHPLQVGGNDKIERYDYPGGYAQRFDGVAPGGGDRAGDIQNIFQDNVRTAAIRMQQETAGAIAIDGTSTCGQFTAGHKFTLDRHFNANGAYVLTQIRHKATLGDSYAVGSDASLIYENAFRGIPLALPFRPERTTPRPTIRGTQSAVVVGNAGDEIFTDKYGRVKVQFPWDRQGKKDANSSCWARVATPWAGKQWGMVHIPRVGQEVVVAFEEGDPDRPIIVGSVYNFENMPPYDLPANMTQSGIKSRSSKGGSPANFNEIRLEDKKGSEQLFIHAEKNQDIEVENDETHWVGRDRTKTIDRDETTHVKRDRTETVDNNEKITIHGNRTEEVDKNEKITIHGARTEEVDKDETITIHGSRKETVDKDENITITGARTENVSKDESITISGNRTENVSKNESITISGGRTENVSKNESITIGGGRTESVAKDESITISGGRVVSVGKDDTLTVGKNLVITAADSITITTGSASISMQKDGTITISGKDITINGSGEIVGKASKNMTLKGQKILQN
jgi:type VI secretion system secreted protein VgrG